MAARGGASSQLQLQSNLAGESFSNEFKELGSKMWLWFGWLCALAQGYNYSCNKKELRSSFYRNLQSWGIKRGWGLDGCAVAQGYTYSYNTIELVHNCKKHLRS